MRRHPVVSALLALLLYAAIALLVTWPLAVSLGTHLPRGQLTSPTVPWFNLWTLEWNADRLAHGYAGYWDAPIFHPVPLAFAMSEPQGLTGILFAPLAAIAGPVAGYNLTLLCLLVFAGLAMRRLSRACGVSSSSALWAGALGVALPFVIKELGVLQLCAVWAPLLVLAEVCSLFGEPTAKSLLRAVLLFAATWWSCEYYALFLCLLLLPAGGMLLARPAFRALLRPWTVLLCLVIVGATTVPLLAVQRQAVAAHERAAAQVRQGSASARSYVRPLRDGLLWRAFGSRQERHRALYPGLLVFGLAVYGFTRDRRGPRQSSVLLLGIVFALALLASFGTRLEFGDFHPYAASIQRWFPGYAQLRSPYRLAMFVHAILVVFAGLGLDALRERLDRRGCGAAVARGLPAVACVMALLEVAPIGQELSAFPAAALDEPWVRWLAAHPGGAVAMVPPPGGNAASAYESTALAMLQGLRHGHPLVNGYSGFFPKRSDKLVSSLARFPRPSCLRGLRDAGVSYAVVEEAWKARHGAQQGYWERLERLVQGDKRSLYRIP